MVMIKKKKVKGFYICFCAFDWSEGRVAIEFGKQEYCGTGCMYW